MKTIKIGLFGFGVVGQGLYQLIQRTQAPVEIKHIGVRNARLERAAPAHLFTTNPRDILDDPELDLIVEAISETEPAFALVQEALQRWIPVVSASKKMLALHLKELLALQQESRTPLVYEAAVGGAIPVLRSLRESLAHEPVLGIRAILNGTTNYILTQMRQQGLSYQQALEKAQGLGFAEANPRSDVEGWDATYKLCLLAWQAFGEFMHPSQVLRQGISQLANHPLDPGVPEARQRLVAQLSRTSEGTLCAQVKPCWLEPGDALYGIEGEQNALELHLAYSGKHLLSGAGAGGLPTASAVLADILALSFPGFPGAKASEGRVSWLTPKFTG